VLLEALAAGLPVAAFPVTGPLDVIGNSGAGTLREDLTEAIDGALGIAADDCRAHAMKFSWADATQQFLAHLRNNTPTVSS
jgi:glycosyltransferase involved in cell wall biosynthesis